MDANQAKISRFTAPANLPFNVSPVFPGLQFAARLIKHYLSGTGTTLDFTPSDFSGGFIDSVGKQVLVAMNANIGLLENDLQANFGSQLCAGQLPPAIFGHTNFLVGNYPFSQQISPGGGYHYGMGTILLNGPFPSAVYLSPYLLAPKHGVVTVKTPIELYDHYDWCYGSAMCESRDVQGPPGFEFFVGEAMSLEKAGRAAQYDWYAQWIVKTEFDVDGTSGTIKITGSRYIGYEKLAGPPLHHTTPMTPTYWNSPNYDDDWLCTQQSHDTPGCG